MTKCILICDIIEQFYSSRLHHTSTGHVRQLKYSINPSSLGQVQSCDHTLRGDWLKANYEIMSQFVPSGRYRTFHVLLKSIDRLLIGGEERVSRSHTNKKVFVKCVATLTVSFSCRLYIIWPVNDFQLCNLINVVRFQIIINLTSHNQFLWENIFTVRS